MKSLPLTDWPRQRTPSCTPRNIRAIFKKVPQASSTAGRDPRPSRACIFAFSRLIILHKRVKRIGQMTSGCFQLAIDERGIEDQLGLGVRDLRLWPALDLALQRLKVPLN